MAVKQETRSILGNQIDDICDDIRKKKEESTSPAHKKYNILPWNPFH